MNLSFCLARCLNLGSTQTGETNRAGSSSSMSDARLPTLPAVLSGDTALREDPYDPLPPPTRPEGKCGME